MSHEQMSEILAMLHGVVENHELIDHAGEVCLEKRLDVIACLAHGLGLGSRHKELLARIMDAYDARCQQRRDHPHPIPTPKLNRLRGL